MNPTQHIQQSGSGVRRRNTIYITENEDNESNQFHPTIRVKNAEDNILIYPLHELHYEFNF